MTNTQLAVLLRVYLRQIGGAVVALKEDLPDSMRKEYKNMLQQEVIHYPALDPLRQIMDDLEQDIETLEAAENYP